MFTQRDWSQGLVPQTVHTKHFEEQVAGTCPKNSNWFEFVGLVAGTKLWFLLLDFEQLYNYKRRLRLIIHSLNTSYGDVKIIRKH